MDFTNVCLLCISLGNFPNTFMPSALGIVVKMSSAETDLSWGLASQLDSSVTSDH